MTQETWLSRVPSKWQTSRLKYLAKFRAGENITGESIRPEGEYPVYGGNGLRGYTDSYTHDGEFVLLGRQGALCGNVNYAHGRFWASEHAVVVKPAVGVHIKWFGELLRSMNLGTYSMSAAQPGLSVEYISNLRAPLPPFETQRRIADYLDAETAEIDALVAEKERMLALLEEKRAALVTHAVTQGLDPHVSLKPSGLEWVDRIPTHWELMQLKRTWSSSEYGISECIRDEGDIRVLRMSCITKDGLIDLKNAGQVEEVPETLLLHEGDLLFNRTNSLDQIAKVGWLPKEPEAPTSFASYLVQIRVNERARQEYLVALLNSRAFLMFARSNAIPAIGQANLSPSRYGNIHIPLPSLDEQNAIVADLSTECAQSKDVERALQSSIDLLRERRSALITAAVAGQLPIEEMTA